VRAPVRCRPQSADPRSPSRSLRITCSRRVPASLRHRPWVLLPPSSGIGLSQRLDHDTGIRSRGRRHAGGHARRRSHTPQVGQSAISAPRASLQRSPRPTDPPCCEGPKPPKTLWSGRGLPQTSLCRHSAAPDYGCRAVSRSPRSRTCSGGGGSANAPAAGRGGTGARGSRTPLPPASGPRSRRSDPMPAGTRLRSRMRSHRRMRDIRSRMDPSDHHDAPRVETTLA
jgi:hypothetical protein